MLLQQTLKVALKPKIQETKGKYIKPKPESIHKGIRNF
jgi:hypothetical protein